MTKKAVQKKWPVSFERVISLIQIVITIAGFYLAYTQLTHIEDTTSGNLTLELYKDLHSDRVFKNNPKIVNSIINNRIILRENGGTFTEEDLDNYLGFFEWLADANQSGVISDDMVYNFHSDLLIDTYNNKEIFDYIQNIRKVNDEYYQGFLDLVDKINNYN